MYSIRFSPILPFTAIALAFFAGRKILKLFASPLDVKNLILLIVQGGFFIFLIVCLFALLTRRHIIIDATNLCIRESCLRNPRIMPLSEIAEVYSGLQHWGFWTRGRKVLSIKMRDGNLFHFFSVNILTDRSREGFVSYLRSIGVTVITDKSASSTGMPNNSQERTE